VIVAVNVKKIQTTKETRVSDTAARDMMKVHAAHLASTPVVETLKFRVSVTFLRPIS